MSSHRKGDISAAAKAEGLSPEIYIVARGQAFHFAETSNGLRDNKGKCNYGVPGSKTVAGKSTVMSELGSSARFSAKGVPCRSWKSDETGRSDGSRISS
jgi:hypothetical protein